LVSTTRPNTAPSVAAGADILPAPDAAAPRPEFDAKPPMTAVPRRLVMRGGRSAGDEREDLREILHGVCVNHEALIFRMGRIQPQSFVAQLWEEHWRRPSRYAGFLAKNYGLRKAAEAIPSALWVIDDLTEGNYYHWLVDSLTRLTAAETLYPDESVLLLPAHYQKHSWVSFTLQAFPRLTVRWVMSDERVRVRRLAFVPYSPPVVLGTAPSFRADLLGEVSRRVGELVDPPSGQRRLYYSRGDTGRRLARNEREVVRVLDSFGVESVQLDVTKPWEQVALSRSASLLVGIHGAALSNMLFMPEGGHILELRRHDREGVYSPDNYMTLAQTMGLGYTRQSCDVAEELPGWDINHADLVVDLDLLRANLEALGSG
jgi:hypothetical protein